ncbi:VanZ family protein [Spirosoma sp. KCTC 42546]|uniref:VanZ family protein n=1 Tax=Spirosoma sp. KCTC 42546 TaxID=2520506 RepID=UPI0011589716|nr:VanZ family protein [Spirosoma sp. KCTC 42546]QDK82733.1 VanZ family protein [Spirosoma sp. KCTC 42546]
MRISLTVFRWLAIVWTIIMLLGCLTPHADLPGELVTFNDKFMHVVIFAPFALLWILAGFRMSYVLVAGVLFGGLIEVLQYVLPINRSADWIDLLADAAGTVVGVFMAWAVHKTYKTIDS